MARGKWILLTKVENSIPEKVGHVGKKKKKRKKEKGTEWGTSEHVLGPVSYSMLLERRDYVEVGVCSGKAILEIFLGVKLWGLKSKVL